MAQGRVKFIDDFLPKKLREVTRDEYEEALATSKKFLALVTSPGWLELEKVIRKQMECRVELILKSPKSEEETLEQQLTRGERLGLALILRTVPAIIQDAEATLEQWRSQPNGPDESQAKPERTNDDSADFRRSP